MMLTVHSNATNLNECNPYGQAGHYFYLSDDVEFLPNNMTFLNVGQVVKAVLSLASEAQISV